MNIITIHQPAFCPWIGFFHKVLLCDTLIWLDIVPLEKNAFHNRNRILMNQNTLWITIPVEMKGHSTRPIANIKIVDSSKTIKKFLTTIQSSYGRFPFFSEVFKILQQGCENHSNLLSVLNRNICNQLFDYLDICVHIDLASDLMNEGRRVNGQELFGTELLLHLCTLKKKSEVENLYIAGGKGKEYLDDSLFDKKGILVFHHEYSPEPYFQKENSAFIPYLSILDLLFRFGKEAKAILQKNQTSRSKLESLFQK